jgi:hypothetical protein
VSSVSVILGPSVLDHDHKLVKVGHEGDQAIFQCDTWKVLTAEDGSQIRQLECGYAELQPTTEDEAVAFDRQRHIDHLEATLAALKDQA